jgi:hypothetical protein
MRHAGETDDVWFVEQLSRLAKDLSDYADMLETEAAAHTDAQSTRHFCDSSDHWLDPQRANETQAGHAGSKPGALD